MIGAYPLKVGRHSVIAGIFRGRIRVRLLSEIYYTSNIIYQKCDPDFQGKCTKEIKRSIFSPEVSLNLKVQVFSEILPNLFFRDLKSAHKN